MFTASSSPRVADAVVASICTMKLCQGSSFSLDAHEQWRGQAARNPILITVSEPESRGSYLKKHTTYVVQQEPQNTRVRRRFSDFEWLHTTLCARYIGMLIPSLPEKTVYKTEAFIRGRMRGLALFLNHVVASPFLRHDASVVGFLNVVDDGEWDHVKKSSVVMEHAGEGHMQWMKCLLHTTLPDDADQLLLNLKRDAEFVDKACNDLLLCSKRLADKSAAYAKELTELATHFQQWKATEYVTVSDKAPEVQSILGHTTTAIGAWSELAQHQPVIHELLLHEGIKYIAHQVKDFKELLRVRDLALVQFDKSNRNRSVTTPPKQSYFVRAEPTGPEAEASAYRYDHIIFCMNRALFFSEIQRLHEIKATILHETFGPFSCAQYQVAKKLGGLWHGYIEAADINQADMMVAAKQVLDLAQVTYDPKVDG
ncbi:hypothetical protein SDRG_05057 [Saprolegnia diclina VS20]|uniref:PX domain-containing protein n=1 Tax=Saprolegnia diclina (strain VS20) TaxID=1156394 RepID=T0QHP8_SAPDV|nr:hypothetical protein SDRG_05057 [Saprolegnia diclina VS20]EQC37454.1 hypothetical protein SDRG_05057 [Saprolegnia diclina VS20]|eukprot:XP_008608974.1 hypothetical protein SDRG_05057 [Saprolegnia diclina VS20]